MEKNRVILVLMETISSSSSDCSTSDNNSSFWSTSSNDSWINDNGNDDLLFFPLLKYITTGNKRCRVQEYIQVVDKWSDLEFKENLRLPKSLALRLIDELQHSEFIPKNNFGKTPISGKICFLVFLWFLSNTEPLRTLADRFDISISSVHRVLRRVLAWILTKLDDVVKWPENNDEVLTICNGFYSKKQIPNILGAIDSTHIRIEKPADNGNDFFNRKKYCSINLQAVVDSRTRFTNVYCGEPGSLHDARVFRRSSLYHSAIENEEILFPNDTFIIDTVLAACILHNYCVDENDDIDDDTEDGLADYSGSNIEDNPPENMNNQNNRHRRESLFRELYL
ncbi:protein ANTAGONIST OF LIKE HETEROCHROMATIN PROTEIN 1-like isoform X2 [Cotesia glomerata]|uniref:protein ANTAGONIST OF LIKE HETEROCHROMATIN PROTEIN 1-like isoform X2 n=1 Tax=Cotesia glomerata TaxID=32391 RepID=UPI001D010B16|nr:protein ANTAGONIST OF LIKE HETEROCHROMATIN PROTEIN 1-like isoform X2 [Cotesia glomerata]XP_044591018.1 protein ANTAGONIST OF LIKE HETEROCHROMATIN PROTEIN 1-like isoform X2 [Cotesia glomerata]